MSNLRVNKTNQFFPLQIDINIPTTVHHPTHHTHNSIHTHKDNPSNTYTQRRTPNKKSPTPLPPPHQLPLLPLPPPPHLFRNPHLHRPLLPLMRPIAPTTIVIRTLTPPQPHKPSEPPPPLLQPRQPIFPSPFHLPKHTHIPTPIPTHVPSITSTRRRNIPPPHNRIRIK